MGLEIEKLGSLAVELMERLEEDYRDEENVTLGVVAVVVEINYGSDIDPESADGGTCAVEYRCSDGRRWIQHGLFSAAVRAVLDSSEYPDE